MYILKLTLLYYIPHDGTLIIRLAKIHGRLFTQLIHHKILLLLD